MQRREIHICSKTLLLLLLLLPHLLSTCYVSAMSVANTYLPLYHDPLTASHLSRVSLPKSLPTPHLKVQRKYSSGVNTCCSSADAAKDPIKKDTDTPIELRYEAFPTVMDISHVKSLLPHRFPFLLVDRLVEFTRGSPGGQGYSVVGIKNITINESYFTGHFPGYPIVPGVLLIEALAQLGGIILKQPEIVPDPNTIFVLVGIDKARIRKKVVPGDTVVMRMTLVKLQTLLGMAKLEGKAYVGGELVCEADILVAFHART